MSRKKSERGRSKALSTVLGIAAPQENWIEYLIQIGYKIWQVSDFESNPSFELTKIILAQVWHGHPLSCGIYRWQGAEPTLVVWPKSFQYVAHTSVNTSDYCATWVASRAHLPLKFDRASKAHGASASRRRECCLNGGWLDRLGWEMRELPSRKAKG